MTILPDIALAQRASKFQVRTDKKPGEVCFGPGPMMTRIDDHGREVVILSRAKRLAAIEREHGDKQVWTDEVPETWLGGIAAVSFAVAGMLAFGVALLIFS